MKVFFLAAAIFVVACAITVSIRSSSSIREEPVIANTTLGREIENAGQSASSLKMALDKGVDPNDFVTLSCEVSTPLYFDLGNTRVGRALLFALRMERKEAAKALIEHGADWRKISVRTDYLLYAASRTYLPLLRTMVEGGVDPNTPLGDSKSTLLHEMARVGYRFDSLRGNALSRSPKAAEAFLKSIEQTQINRIEEYVGFASWLVDKGANLNAKNTSGDTPLHMCARNKNGAKYASMLVLRGADVNVVNNEGHTPLDVAILSLNKEVVALLKKAGAKYSKSRSVDQVGDIVSLLRKYGANDVK